MRSLVRFSALLAILFAGSFVAGGGLDPRVAKPPVARKVAKTTTLHGDTRVDYYQWLCDKTDKEVIAYLNAENAYTAAVMKPTEALQETLYKEMLGRIKQTDLSVPYRLGDYFYYTRTVQGKQYNIHCRKKATPLTPNPSPPRGEGKLDSEEEIILDLNELAKGQKFLMLGPHEISDDGNLLAYAIDVTGFRQFKLFVKDLRTGQLLPDRIDKIVAVAWAADNKTLFVIREDHAKRPYRLDRHVLGADGEQPVYEEKDELYRLGVSRSRDKKYLFAHSTSSTTSEERYLPSDQPTGEWRVVLPREEGHRYFVNHRDGVFYIRTNKDAKNYRLVTAPVADPSPKNWREMIPHRPDVLLQNIDLFEHHAVVSERANGLPGLKVIDLRDNKSHNIEFPEPIHSAMGSVNPEYKTTHYRFNYQSLLTPDSVFDYDLDKRTRKLMKRTEVLGGYNPDDYASERRFAAASDGAKIPISLIWKKGVPRDGTAPMLLNGYGAYGASLPISFQSMRLSLLDRGVVFAMAHVRGGGDMGEIWHDQGKMMEKRNSFTDFIACADHLVENKYASRDRLVIQGASAGGLLMGGTLAIRPDVAKAVVLQVPFVDVINTMLDTSLPLTIQEFLEWGNPQIKKEYEYIKTYCPYTNLKAQSYPAMLLTTSLNDSQVMYFEPAKYTAKLRSLKTDNNVLLLKCNMAGGHGGFSGRYDALRDQAFIMAFVLKQMGVAQ
jgi:oligopeptidase B